MRWRAAQGREPLDHKDAVALPSRADGGRGAGGTAADDDGVPAAQDRQGACTKDVRIHVHSN